MKPRVLYEVDPYNRLIIRKSGKSSNLKKFRRVAYGRFKTDARNKLYYEVTGPCGSDIPQRVGFSGEYSLNKKDNLVYTLDKSNNQREGNRLRLKTGIIDAGNKEIAFLVSSRESEKKKTVTTMKLNGVWRVDKNNRLVFAVKKEDNKKDDLTLSNAWQINKNNEIVYICGKDNKITFKGHWDVRDKHRISYAFTKDVDSGFDFRASLGRIAPRKEKAYATFNIAIDISRKKRITRRVTFSSKYKPGKGKEILLEISPGKKKVVVLKLTREVLGGRGTAYMETFVKDKEKYAGGGLVFRW